jgi:CheY-like chemotaxis protein
MTPLFAEEFPLRILIAEDDYILRRTLTILLKGLGYDVESVENGAECLSAGMTQAYDLILTDLEMPEMNGVDCATHLREAGVKTRIIALTGSAVTNAREGCLRAGMNGYLAKPITQNVIKNSLREVFENKGKALWQMKEQQSFSPAIH